MSSLQRMTVASRITFLSGRCLYTTSHNRATTKRNSSLKSSSTLTKSSNTPSYESTSSFSLPASSSQRSTIYALATPPGRGGIGVIRISGPHASKVWRHMLVSAKRGAPMSVPSRHGTKKAGMLYRCRVVHPTTGEAIDDGMAVFFQGPYSYTSEDVLELHIHSGRAIIAAILSSLRLIPDASLRLAERGEFTRRAFESGRIDLTEAEGIRDLIDAETEAQRKLALNAAEGLVKERFEHLRNGIIKVLASVEALIDFGEGEEIEHGVWDQARHDATELRRQLLSHVCDNRRGEILRSGIRLAIFGPPNAGKSSLLNSLAQRQAAIVTPLPGTTRDVLEVSLDIGGMPVIACDTAGIRESDDVVEKIGIERATDVIRTADLKLCVLSLPELIRSHSALSSSQHIKDIFPPDISQHLTPNAVVFLNKNDVVPHNEALTLENSEEKLEISLALKAREDILTYLRENTRCVWEGSVIEGNAGGMDKLMEGLVEELKQRVSAGEDNDTDQDVPLITRARHREHLEMAVLHLDVFLQSDGPENIVPGAEELRYAAREIGMISGSIDVEDVLDSIFRDFCIGK